MKKTTNQAVTDRLFIQEIINDLERNGYAHGGKAHIMLHDWSRELSRKANMRGRTKKFFRQLVGIQNY